MDHLEENTIIGYVGGNLAAEAAMQRGVDATSRGDHEGALAAFREAAQLNVWTISGGAVSDLRIERIDPPEYSASCDSTPLSGLRDLLLLRGRGEHAFSTAAGPNGNRGSEIRSASRGS